MRLRSYLRLSGALLVALCAMAVALFVLERPAARAEPLVPSNTLTYPSVSPPCNTTLQACISAANNGDVVNVLAGTYITNQLIITRAIVLHGAGASSTILQALGAQRVISVGANIAAGVTISNLRVFSGSLTSGGGLGAGIFGSIGTPLTLLNMDVMSNTNSTNSGGGIFASAALTMADVDVIGNSDAGGAGGGLRAGSSANIIGGRFERNTSFNAGGAMRATGALTLTNVTVISNVVTNAGQDGGGISALGGLFMQGTLLQNNLAPNSGGGINANAATITASNIISNAANNGGGIFVTGGLNITNTTFSQNKARAGNGGAIDASGNVTISIEGTSSVSKTTISNSSAITHGGGIFAAGSVLLVGAVSFNSDKALNGEGGAIFTNDLIDSSGTSVLLAVTFTGNTALGKGGAVRALGNVSLLNLPRFQNNSAGGGTTADGGAIYADGSVFLQRGTSTGNTARNGGAVYALGNIFFNYAPPFFSSQKGVLGRVLGGWNISPLFVYGSGFPVQVQTPNGNCGTLGECNTAYVGANENMIIGDNLNYSATRKQNVKGTNCGTAGPGQNVLSNPDASCPVNGGVFGDPVRAPILGLDGQIGGFPVRGLALWNLDLGLSKRIRFTERFSSTLHFDFANVLNHMQAADPCFSTADTSTWGVLGACGSGNVQANNPRRMQLGLTIQW